MTKHPLRLSQTPAGRIAGPGAIPFIFIMAALKQLPRMLRTEELSEEEETSVFVAVSAAQLDKMQRQIPLLQEHPPAAKLHQRQAVTKDSPAIMGRSSPPGQIIER